MQVICGTKDTIVPKYYRKVDLYNDDFSFYNESIQKELTCHKNNNNMDTIYVDIRDLNSSEYTYLNALNNILKNGDTVPDRTGTGTISLFNVNTVYDITVLNPNDKVTDHRYKIPIFTTKSVYFKGVITELLWFLRGETDTNILKDQGNHIWDGNTSKESLKKLNLDYEEGQLGPGYGYQWIHWNGDWRTSTGGINQIEKIINTLKSDPFSRRLVLNGWNVSDLDAMALPPCHLMYIFKTSLDKSGDKVLNCQVTLRSNDMFLGHPFNVVSASMLTIMIARCTNMIPGQIALSITDAHIYRNHVDQVNLQCSREPLIQPYVSFDKELNCYEDIIKLEYDDFKLTKYKFWPKIDAVMAV
jgi:thymidylate synthase